MMHLTTKRGLISAMRSIHCLDQLEAESIYILREVAAQFERPVMLYSVGKDSSALLRLVQKAFAPGPVPFPLMHVDTGFKFPEMYRFRDKVIAKAGLTLIVHRNESAISGGASPDVLGTQGCCGVLKTKALLDAIKAGRFDGVIGGARREEERSRAKERIFSVRNKEGQWDPLSQRPELWNFLNGKVKKGETMRIFPLSNWTELDIWSYIDREKIPVVSLYFAKKRSIVERAGQLIQVGPGVSLGKSEKVRQVFCRFRSLGCVPCSGAVLSKAKSVPEIIKELQKTRSSERATRVIDYDADGSMETKKREGYF